MRQCDNTCSGVAIYAVLKQDLPSDLVTHSVVMPDDSIAVRSMMYGTHTYDHRIIDGELGGKFLESIHKNLRQLDVKSLF